jgi:hypothetical protein
MGKDATGMRSMEFSIERDIGNPVGFVKTSTNVLSKGSMFGGVGVEKLSGLTWCTKNKEMHLFMLTCLIVALSISDRVGLGEDDVRT